MTCWKPCSRCISATRICRVIKRHLRTGPTSNRANGVQPMPCRRSTPATWLSVSLPPENKVKVLWIYGADDVAVSNSAASDPGTWGPTGQTPRFPGSRRVSAATDDGTDQDTARRLCRPGGSYEEVAVEGSGHVPFITHQDEFNKVFHAFLQTG